MMGWCLCERPLRRRSFTKCVTCGNVIRLNKEEYRHMDGRLRVRTFVFELVHKTLDWEILTKQCKTPCKCYDGSSIPLNERHGEHTDWKLFEKNRDAMITKVLNGFRSLGGYVVLESPNYHDEAYAVWVVEWDSNYYILKAHEFPSSLTLEIQVFNVDRLAGKFEMLVDMIFMEYKFTKKSDATPLHWVPLTVKQVMNLATLCADEEYNRLYGNREIDRVSQALSDQDM